MRRDSRVLLMTVVESADAIADDDDVLAQLLTRNAQRDPLKGLPSKATIDIKIPIKTEDLPHIQPL